MFVLPWYWIDLVDSEKVVFPIIAIYLVIILMAEDDWF